MSQWVDEDAKAFCERYAAYGEDRALRVYTTRLLGQDPSLVLHGGGNTSVKTIAVDELGRDVSVLSVKGSGWDMGSIEPEGLPLVSLEPIREFRALTAMTDEAMVNGVRRFLLDTTAPTPSVETLLHAFLPHKFVDHTHADAILALADQPDAESLCRRVFGEKFGIVPYIMPGFELAKETARIFEADPEVVGMILINHGIFTFGETARVAYERMTDAVAVAERFINRKTGKAVYLNESSSTEKPERYFEHMAILRGCLSARPEGIGRQVLHWRKSEQIDAFLNRSDLADLAGRGPATPDHVIRTKQKPLIIETVDEDPNAFKSGLEPMLDRYIAAYQSYFKAQTTAKGVDKKQVHPLPVVFLLRGLGLVTAGKTEKEARVAADIYEHTIDVILKANRVGQYQPLADDLLFDMEYWSLEQAKLGKKRPAALAGSIVLVTGAGGGIGRAVAEKFASMGANLVLTDFGGDKLKDLGRRALATLSNRNRRLRRGYDR